MITQKMILSIYDIFLEFKRSLPKYLPLKPWGKSTKIIFLKKSFKGMICTCITDT
jgi:hypothetical protein